MVISLSLSNMLFLLQINSTDVLTAFLKSFIVLVTLAHSFESIILKDISLINLLLDDSQVRNIQGAPTLVLCPYPTEFQSKLSPYSLKCFCIAL